MHNMSMVNSMLNRNVRVFFPLKKSQTESQISAYVWIFFGL